MALLTLSPLAILIIAALFIWIMSGRVRAYYLGLTTLGVILALIGLVASQPLWIGSQQTTLPWGTLNGVPLMLRFDTSEPASFFALLLLSSGAITAGGLASTFGRTTRVLGLVFAGLLILLLGGLITAYSVTPIGAIAGLGITWLGSTVMQQSATAHNHNASFGGLPVLLLAVAMLAYAATPTLAGGSVLGGPWLAGCGILIGLAPRFSTTTTSPILVRAPTLALGLPLLGGYLLVRYGIATAALWSQQLTGSVLLLGVLGLILGAVNALTARRLLDAFSWQLLAQLSLLAVSFGTGHPAAGPIATGLLVHTAVTGTSLALALGQLERATRTELIAALPPLPEPLRRAGLAYGIAAMSCAGLPPLLGYALRRVVVLLAPAQPWLTPVLLAASTLLALSYLPTLAAFFRRPAFRSPIGALEQRGGGWPLLLMLGLLLGGLIPDQIWQWVLGDPATPELQLPSPATLISTGMTTFFILVLFGIANRALRHPRPPVQFAGGEPLDEEPGWALPFVALRATLSPLVIPDEPPGRALGQWLARQRERVAVPLQVLERRYYLAVVVTSLIGVLLLAAQ